MRVLLADDESKVRSALRLLLEHERGIDQIDEADSVTALMCRARQCPADLLLRLGAATSLATPAPEPVQRILSQGGNHRPEQPT